MSNPKITVTENGPYLVSGNVPLSKKIIIADDKGCSAKWQEDKQYPRKETYKLCRCGHSKTKPYCDSSHIDVEFDGTETTSKEPYVEQAEKFDGPKLILSDARALCSSARFCDRAGGIWELTKKSDNEKSKKIAIEEGCDCPSGRLVVYDKESKKEIEPEFEKSIGLVEDPEMGVSGPIWVRGKIPVESADGHQYEIRNRVTLCRCGKSTNKPFCDGTHIDIEFSDEK